MSQIICMSRCVLCQDVMNKFFLISDFGKCQAVRLLKMDPPRSALQNSFIQKSGSIGSDPDIYSCDLL